MNAAITPSVRRAFTLMELLVVIAIVAALAGLLLPAIRMVRESAKRIDCLSKLRQMSIAAVTYQADFDGRFPYAAAHEVGATWWVTTGDLTAAGQTAQVSFASKMVPYLDSMVKVFICPNATVGVGVPTDGRISYIANGVVTHYSGWKLSGAGSVIAFKDDGATTITATLRPHWSGGGIPSAGVAGWSGWQKFGGGALIPSYVHNNATNAVFMDGHAESLYSAKVTSGSFGVLIGGLDNNEGSGAYGDPSRIGIRSPR